MPQKETRTIIISPLGVVISFMWQRVLLSAEGQLVPLKGFNWHISFRACDHITPFTHSHSPLDGMGLAKSVVPLAEDVSTMMEV